MEFIVENYIWFIIGGIVILMTIIGYIADKTNFTKKEKNIRKVKPMKKEVLEEQETTNVEPAFTTDEVIEPIVDNPNESSVYENDLMFENVSEPVVDDPNDSNTYESNQLTDLEENNEISDENENTEIVFEEPNLQDLDSLEKSKNENSEENSEEIMLNSEDNSQNIEENNQVVNEEPIDEDLYVGLDGTPNAFKNEKNDLEIELPSISSLDNEIKEETEEDDVWKF